MMKNLALMIMLILNSWSAQAADDDLVETPKEASTAENLLIESAAGKKCDFKINCKVSGKDLVFDYVTTGNVCNQSNPGSLIMTTKNKRYSLGVQGLSLKKSEDFGNSKQICEIGGRKYPAKLLTNDKILLFIRSESLPGFDKLGGILIDTKENKVLKFAPNLGQIKNVSLALLNTEKGAMKTRIVKQMIQGVKCDCDAAYLDDWKEIAVQNNTITTKWMEIKK